MSLSSPQSHVRRPSGPRMSRTQGAALVIVLAFVVLITGLMVAYFSRSVASRQLSNSSAGQTKSSLLAQSASDIIIAGLKQEIAAGSAPTPSPTATPTPPAAFTPYLYYVPLKMANAVPVRYGTPAPIGSPAVEAIPNLVRRSVANDSNITAPAVASLASAVNSATDPAIGGRSISLARWNSHYLIPRYSADTASSPSPTPSQPDASVGFVAPDWVLVTRGGPVVETVIGTGATAINNLLSTNQNYVVGRYAYAIYDEGGLLDMNVAGYPQVAPTPPLSQSGFTSAQISRKGSLALADLTQLPVVKSPAATGDYLSSTVVNNIVGWRNYAASNLITTPALDFYPGFTFTAAQATSWFTNFASNNSTGFLTTYSAVPAAGSTPAPTDQAFLSRQQLLRLRSSIGFSPNVLQYMGTFSRSLEQPSFVPAHIQYPDMSSAATSNIAPSVNALSTATPPPATVVKTYLGNNDAAGYSNSVAGQDLINPSLLPIRVKNAFTRADFNHTLAVVGEPLLKKKFPLNRLAEINYAYTDLTPSLTDSNFTPIPSNPTAKNHIQDWFGLSRTSASSPWTYNHGSVASDGSVSIMTLDKVAALTGISAREPDFAELLKAAINVGSLAKGGPNLHSDQGNYQYTLDVSVDYNVLQIMANLIDQYDTDGYPTIIQVKSGSSTGSVWRTFRGVEDLPYFYRYHPMSVVTATPSPMLNKTNTVDWHNVGEAASTKAFKTSYDCVPGNNLTSQGQVVDLYIPDIWNPHDASTTLTNPGSARPSRLRLAVLSQDPAAQTPVWSPGVIPRVNGDWYDLIPQKATIPTTFQSMATESATSFTFSDNSGALFREPTLLWRADVPANCNLVPDTARAGPYIDVNSKISYYGVQIGQTVASYVGTVDLTKYFSVPASTTPTAATGQYVFQTDHLDIDFDTKRPAGAYAQYTFRLQYLDPNGSGNWITYDEKYPDFHGLDSPTTVVNQADYPNNQWMNVYSTNQFRGASTDYDPRTPRFGIGTADALNNSGPPMLEPAAVSNYNTNDSTHNTAFGASNFTILVTQRPLLDRGNEPNYSTPGMASDDLGGNNLQERFFSGNGWNASATYAGASAWPVMYDGVLFAQNNPNINILARDNATIAHLYYEDADGMARRGMGAYVTTSLPVSKSAAALAATNLVGQPLATANSYSATSPAGTPTSQSLSRPIILNRPFRSVAEMSYASRGAPWKQIDFFTPESGDTGLLDVFCVSETPSDGIVAGKINLNTHQIPVLSAVVAGTARDELNNLANAKTWELPPLNGVEATNVAKTLVGITTDTTNAWRGPLTNVGQLVGHFVPVAPVSSTLTDFYTFNEPVAPKTYSYAGLSAALDNTVYTANIAAPANYLIQRMRESAIRALADSGQTRVWNLMIDVVAQTGRYTSNATSLTQFNVDGESRYWVHVAIDRYTGEVIDKQIELVSE